MRGTKATLTELTFIIESCGSETNAQILLIVTIGVSSCPRGDASGVLSGALDAAAACCVALKALAREVLISCSLMAQPRALQSEDNIFHKA